MSAFTAAMVGGAVLFIAWLVIELIRVSLPKRRNRHARRRTDVLPDPSPACERVWRLIER